MIDVPLCLPFQANIIYEQASFVTLLFNIGFFDGEPPLEGLLTQHLQ